MRNIMSNVRIVDGLIMTIEDDDANDNIEDLDFSAVASNKNVKSKRLKRRRTDADDDDDDGGDEKLRMAHDDGRTIFDTKSTFKFDADDAAALTASLPPVSRTRTLLSHRVADRLAMAKFYRQQRREAGERVSESDTDTDDEDDNGVDGDTEMAPIDVDGLDQLQDILPPSSGEVDDDDDHDDVDDDESDNGDEDDDDDGDDDDVDGDNAMEDDEDSDEQEAVVRPSKSSTSKPPTAVPATKSKHISAATAVPSSVPHLPHKPVLLSADENEDESRPPVVTDYDTSLLGPVDAFSSFALSRKLLRGLSDMALLTPTPVQQHVIPLGLAGKDVLVSALTGSGKTLSFLLPVCERLLQCSSQRAVSRILILLPTRELATQCYDVTTKLTAHTDIRAALVVGGLSASAQETALRSRPDIIIATPGRLIDHLRNTATVHLDDLEVLILDEADRLCELGFTDELTEIIRQCPRGRQTMLFSATMNQTSVQDLIKLSLNHPMRVTINPSNTLTTQLTQEFIRIRPGREGDRESIIIALCKRSFKSKTMIFCPSKHICHRLMILFHLFSLNATELQGNLTQNQRLESLNEFKSGTVNFLICTDLAARGLDVEGVETVINTSMPKDLKLYIHRVGRTARAGRHGHAVTLCSEKDRKSMRDLIKQSKNSHLHSNIQSRIILPKIISHYRQRIEGFTEDIQAIMDSEKLDKEQRVAEMEANKARNLLVFEDEIQSRPMRTWFQTEQQKLTAKLTGERLHGQDMTAQNAKQASKDDEDDDDDSSHDDAQSSKAGNGQDKKARGAPTGSKSKKEDPLRGLSRYAKRRKLMQMEAERDAAARIRAAKREDPNADVAPIKARDVVAHSQRIAGRAKHLHHNANAHDDGLSEQQRYESERKKLKSLNGKSAATPKRSRESGDVDDESEFAKHTQGRTHRRAPQFTASTKSHSNGADRKRPRSRDHANSSRDGSGTDKMRSNKKKGSQKSKKSFKSKSKHKRR